MAKWELYTYSKERFKKQQETQGFCNWQIFEDNFLLECWNMKNPKTGNVEPTIIQFWKNGAGYEIFRSELPSSIQKNYILFNADIHHSHASKIILGVFDNMVDAISGAVFHSKEFNDDLSADDIESLTKQQQTQSRDNNYLIKEYNTNEVNI